MRVDVRLHIRRHADTKWTMVMLMMMVGCVRETLCVCAFTSAYTCVRVCVSARTHLHLYTCARVCVYHLSVLLILFPCSQWSDMSSSSCTTPTPLATRALTTPKVGWGGRWGVQISYRRISQNNHQKPNKNENSRQTKPYTGPVWLLDDPQQPNDGQKLKVLY